MIKLSEKLLHVGHVTTRVCSVAATSVVGPRYLLLQQCGTPSLIVSRHFSSKKFTRNIEFFTPSDRPLPKERTDLTVAQHLSDECRPLVLVYSWLMAKDKHVRKYTKFYNDLGLDVLKVRCSPFDALRPVKGTQVIADNVLEFLHINPNYSSILVHGFSVGAYSFAEVMVKISNDMSRHGSLLPRFTGQIYDSGADVVAIPWGFSKAITDNKLLQASIQSYLEWYLRSQYEVATKYYEAASKKMHGCFLNVPSLLLFSKSDPKWYRKNNRSVKVFIAWSDPEKSGSSV